MGYLNKHYLLCIHQFAFREDCLAADLHLLMMSDWYDALDHGQSVCVIALDIEGAFDRVWYDAMVEKLQAVGVKGNYWHY